MMTKEVGTLREIGAQVGDVVSFGFGDLTVTRIDCDGYYFVIDEDGEVRGPVGNANPWRIIYRATPQPKLWRDMTPEEKGALLLAEYEGKVIEFKWVGCRKWNKIIDKPNWFGDYAYRVKPEPKVETVTLNGDGVAYWGIGKNTHDTHRITFQTIDGKPDCASIKMEEL